MLGIGRSFVTSSAVPAATKIGTIPIMAQKRLWNLEALTWSGTPGPRSGTPGTVRTRNAGPDPERPDPGNPGPDDGDDHDNDNNNNSSSNNRNSKKNHNNKNNKKNNIDGTGTLIARKRYPRCPEGEWGTDVSLHCKNAYLVWVL